MAVDAEVYSSRASCGALYPKMGLDRKIVSLRQWPPVFAETISSLVV